MSRLWCDGFVARCAVPALWLSAISVCGEYASCALGSNR